VAQLHDQLVWLKLGDQPVTDSHLSKISSLKNIVRLSLENTAITDVGLSELAALSRLQYLNLTGTSITSAGLSKLGVLKELRSVYIFKTGIKPEELEILRKQFINTTIESGNYEVPTLESDTTLVKSPVTN
jgi:Leucine-rich repeat (LRR) protein